MPVATREAWLAATGGVVAEDGPQDRNVGRTEAAQAYRLLHTGMAQAVADGLIPANPCLVKGASQRDSKDRTERRTATPQEIWALADAMPERYRAELAVTERFIRKLIADGQLRAVKVGTRVMRRRPRARRVRSLRTGAFGRCSSAGTSDMGMADVGGFHAHFASP